jgi:hypothetical protein
MRQQTRAELIAAKERAEARNVWDTWLVRALHPAPGWRVIVPPRGYQILLARISPQGDAFIWNTMEAEWPAVRAELLRQADRAGMQEYESLAAALADVSRAKSARGIE